MKALICGGRNFTNKIRMAEELDGLGITLVIHGDAGRVDREGKVVSGADKFAGEWADVRGIPVKAFPAKWAQFGKKAGPLRNTQMIDEEQPDIVIAFPGGTGTFDMTSKAEFKKIPVIYIKNGSA